MLNFINFYNHLLRLPKVLKKRDFYYSVQTKCKKMLLGDKGAEWMICPENINSNSIIYSFGIGENISFDLALIEKFQVTVHAFDPTPKSIKWIKSQNLPELFKWYEFGLADYDGEAIFYLPQNPDYVSYSMIDGITENKQSVNVNVHRMVTIMKMLNHTKIDILKMDIEGAEYAALDDILNSPVQIDQILIEFHHRFKNIGIEKSISAIKKLNNKGYKIFYISPSGEEYSFIKTSGFN